MNWKIIVGALLIFGGVKEMFAEFEDYHNGVTHFNPIVPALGCLTLIGVGIYLMIKGREKKNIVK